MEVVPSLSKMRLRFRRESGMGCSSVDKGGGNERGRVCESKAERAMDPHPPAAQMMRRKWDMRSANPVWR